MHLSEKDQIFIQRESWAAFFNPFIWALAHRMWGWALLSLIPVVNAYVWIRLWLGGRSLSWKSSEWTIESFRNRERVLLWVNLLLILIPMGIWIVMAFQLSQEAVTAL